MSFDERPESDPHHECRNEIDELRKIIEFKNNLIESYKLAEDRWREAAIKEQKIKPDKDGVLYCPCGWEMSGGGCPVGH